MGMGNYGGDEELPIYDGDPEDVPRTLDGASQDDMDGDDDDSA